MPPDYSGAASRNNRYFGTIKKMLYEDTIARVHWQEDGTTSIVDIDILQLETVMPKKNKFQMRPHVVIFVSSQHLLCRIQLMIEYSYEL